MSRFGSAQIFVAVMPEVALGKRFGWCDHVHIVASFDLVFLFRIFLNFLARVSRFYFS